MTHETSLPADTEDRTTALRQIRREIETKLLELSALRKRESELNSGESYDSIVEATKAIKKLEGMVCAIHYYRGKTGRGLREAHDFVTKVME